MEAVVQHVEGAINFEIDNEIKKNLVWLKKGRLNSFFIFSKIFTLSIYHDIKTVDNLKFK